MQTTQKKNWIDGTRESLRRSLRKQSSNATVEPKASPVVAVQSALSDSIKLQARPSSKSRHHKTKAKHHKDKRKKKRHLKAMDFVSSIETANQSCNNATSGEEAEICVKRENSILTSGVNVGANLKDTTKVVSIRTKTERVDSIEMIGNVNTGENLLYRDIKNVDTKRVVTISDSSEQSRLNGLEISAVANNKCNLDKTITQALDGIDDGTSSCGQPVEMGQNDNVLSGSRYIDDCEDENATTDRQAEDRKLKKKRKRLKHDVQGVEDENTMGDSSEELLDDSVHKHRKKRHKHTGEHRNRRHHDVRKAPQDGIIVRDDMNVCFVADDTSAITSSEHQSGTGVDPLILEPQRLAIKIKLCQECNNRHLQDACPLTTPLYAIPDSISYEDWLYKHKENDEILKVVKFGDPMSEGYGKMTEDNTESDDDSSLTDQHKTRTKGQKEEKRLIVDTDRPLYARDSLPDCFELRITNSEHGLGIYAKSSVPMHVKLGPLVGRPVREMDIPDDFSMRHIWEVQTTLFSYHQSYRPRRPDFARFYTYLQILPISTPAIKRYFFGFYFSR